MGGQDKDPGLILFDTKTVWDLFSKEVKYFYKNLTEWSRVRDRMPEKKPQSDIPFKFKNKQRVLAIIKTGDATSSFTGKVVARFFESKQGVNCYRIKKDVPGKYFIGESDCCIALEDELIFLPSGSKLGNFITKLVN